MPKGPTNLEKKNNLAWDFQLRLKIGNGRSTIGKCTGPKSRRRKRWKTNGETMVDFWCRFFSRFGADFFTVYADFSRFIRDINGEKKTSRYWWSFSRLVLHGLPPLDKMVQNGPNDHFGQNDLINDLDFSIRETKMDQNGPLWTILAFLTTSLENSNIDWTFQSRPSEVPTKKGPWRVARLKWSISLEICNPGETSWIFQSLGPYGFGGAQLESHRTSWWHRAIRATNLQFLALTILFENITF